MCNCDGRKPSWRFAICDDGRCISLGSPRSFSWGLEAIGAVAQKSARQEKGRERGSVNGVSVSEVGKKCTR